MVAAPQQAGALQTPLSEEQRAALWLQGSGGAQLRRDSPRSYAELAAAAMDEQEVIIDAESLVCVCLSVCLCLSVSVSVCRALSLSLAL